VPYAYVTPLALGDAERTAAMASKSVTDKRVRHDR